VATIVGMKLKVRGFNVDEIVTFGAPKVTDTEGSQKEPSIPRILHVTQFLDPIPYLPCGFRTLFSGPFTRYGDQLLLFPPCNETGRLKFCYLPHRSASIPWTSSILLHLTRHHGINSHKMRNYVQTLEGIVASPDLAEKIPFNQRFTSDKRRISEFFSMLASQLN